MIQIDLKLFDKIEDLTLPEYLVLCVIYEDLDYFNCITDNKTINLTNTIFFFILFFQVRLFYW